MTEAKLFKSGNSQAIRLPKEYRIEGDSIGIKRIGNLIVLVPKDNPWKMFIEGVNESEGLPDLNNKKLKLRKVEIG